MRGFEGYYMLKFLKEHSYDAVKMFVTQCAISIFGLVLALACGMAKNDGLRLFCSIFAILFYLFLLYTSAWELGSKHCIPVQYGHRSARPLLGLYLSLTANVLNILLAIGFTLGALFPTVYVLEQIGAWSGSIAIFMQGMYAGVLAVEVSGHVLNTLWFMYFLTPIPALVISTLGYYFGLKNIKFTKFFDAKPEKATMAKHKKDDDTEK